MFTGAAALVPMFPPPVVNATVLPLTKPAPVMVPVPVAVIVLVRDALEAPFKTTELLVPVPTSDVLPKACIPVGATVNVALLPVWIMSKVETAPEPVDTRADLSVERYAAPAPRVSAETVPEPRRMRLFTLPIAAL